MGAKAVRVRYTVRSVDIRPGDEATVSEEQAADLVAHRHAVVVPAEKAKKKV